MGAAFEYLPSLDDQDLIGASDRRKPMGDHKSSTAAARLLSPSWISASDFAVEARGGLVEDQNTRVGEVLWRSRSAAVGLGELYAAFADDGFIAIRKLLDELIRIRHAAHLADGLK